MKLNKWFNKLACNCMCISPFHSNMVLTSRFTALALSIACCNISHCAVCTFTSSHWTLVQTSDLYWMNSSCFEQSECVRFSLVILTEFTRLLFFVIFVTNKALVTISNEFFLNWSHSSFSVYSFRNKTIDINFKSRKKQFSGFFSIKTVL